MISAEKKLKKGRKFSACFNMSKSFDNIIFNKVKVLLKNTITSYIKENQNFLKHLIFHNGGYYLRLII